MVSAYFRDRREDPERGTIEVFGERYVLVRAASLSVEFFRVCQELYGDGREAEANEFARNILFDLAHSIGKSDAKNFHAKMGLIDPVAKLSAGPVHFAHTGWAFVDISPESKPVPDEGFFLLYDHPSSFEADAWLAAGRTQSFPVCIMNSGYSSGWCEESFGVPLVAAELQCRARGDAACRFVMAHPQRIEAHLDARVARGRANIPDFFSRKRMEDELRRAHDELEQRVTEEIARREGAERQLARAQRLEALGRLSGGIAHDFNNMIAVMLANSSVLRERLGPKDPRVRFADEVIAACDRATKLVKQLLAFASSQAITRERLELGAAVARASGMLARLIGDDIELAVLDEGPEAWIEFDPTQLDQVILNLVVNARDAMKAGGRVTLTVGRRLLDRDLATALQVEPGAYVSLSVADTGAGIDPAVLPQIFDPFFTTKPEGRGTGLGLATVYGVVRQAGGAVTVESTPGQGTTFEILFPAAAASERPPAAAPGEAPLRGHETVLLVEDAHELRAVLATILQGLGYVVLVARDVEHALELSSRRAIDLLLTDVVMPRMRGPELAERVRALQPRAKVLFMSGYAEAGASDHPSGPWLIKPFSPEELARRVGAALREP